MTSIVLTALGSKIQYASGSLRQIGEQSTTCEKVVLITSSSLLTPEVEAARRTAESYGIKLLPLALQDLQTDLRKKHPQFGASSTVHPRPLSHLPELLANFDEVVVLDVATLLRRNIDELLQWKLQQPVAAVQMLDTYASRKECGTGNIPVETSVLRVSLSALRSSECGCRGNGHQDDIRIDPSRDRGIEDLALRQAFELMPVGVAVPDDIFESNASAFLSLQDPLIITFRDSALPWNTQNTSDSARDWRRHFAISAGLSASSSDSFVQGQIPRRPMDPLVLANSIRESRLGAAVRSRLSTELKDTVKIRIHSVVHRRSGHENNASPAMEGSGYAVRPSDRESASASFPSESAIETPGSDRAQLVLLCSIPRSGTNALLSIMDQVPVELSIEGEFFLGQVKAETQRILEPSFPWIGYKQQLRAERQSTGPIDPRWSEFTQRMNEQVEQVLTALLRARRGRVVIKALPSPFSQALMIHIIRTFEPQVVFLRRIMALSFQSFLKASSDSSWIGVDNTDNLVNFREQSARAYVRQADSWFTCLHREVTALGLDVLDLTYQDVIESSSRIPDLYKFLGASPRQSPTTGATTLKQDRRSDESVAATLRSFTSLPLDLQQQLLRLPRISV